MLTVRAYSGEKVAVTATAEVPMVKVHGSVPEHAPVHPAKKEPPAAVAVSVTDVPVLSGVLVQPPGTAGQLIPPTSLVTLPLPLPAGVTVTGNAAGIKSALTDCAWLMVTEQVPVPEQAPLQPANTEAAEAGVAVSVTAVFWT
jgi:hypothetical protein